MNKNYIQEHLFEIDDQDECRLHCCEVKPKKIRVKKVKPEIIVPLEFDKSFLFDACHNAEFNLIQVVKRALQHKKEFVLALPRYRPADLQELIEYFGWHFFTSNRTFLLEMAGIDMSGWKTIGTKEEYYEWILSKSLQWIVKELDKELLRSQNYFTNDQLEMNHLRWTSNIHIWGAKKHDQRFVKLLLRNFENYFREVLYSKPKAQKHNKNEFDYIYGHECIY